MNEKCIMCGHELAVERHHTVPDKLDETWDNTIPLCPTHHAIVHKYILWDLLKWIKENYQPEIEIDEGCHWENDEGYDATNPSIQSRQPHYDDLDEAKFVCIKCGTVITKAYTVYGSIFPPKRCYEMQGGCGRENMVMWERQEQDAEGTYFVMAGMAGDVPEWKWKPEISELTLPCIYDGYEGNLDIDVNLTGESPGKQNIQHWIKHYIRNHARPTKEDIIEAATEKIEGEIDRMLREGHLYHPSDKENIYAEA